MCHPRPLFVLFLYFQTKNTIITIEIFVNNCPSSIQYGDSNPRPSEHEFPPITTRPFHSKYLQYLDQRTLTVGGSITVQMVCCFTSIDSTASLHNNKHIFCCLVNSNLIKKETSRIRIPFDEYSLIKSTIHKFAFKCL